MTKKFFGAILVFFMMAGGLAYAQSNSGFTKVFSGYLHDGNAKNHHSFFHAIFGPKSSKQADADKNLVCSLEFKCPPVVAHQPLIEVPEELTYYIRFSPPVSQNDFFEKFIIKIYTNNDEEYSIDPNEEDKQVGINEAHHVNDTYLVYLILGHDINHLEIVSASGDTSKEYVLDKIEIKDGQ